MIRATKQYPSAVYCKHPRTAGWRHLKPPAASESSKFPRPSARPWCCCTQSSTTRALFFIIVVWSLKVVRRFVDVNFCFIPMKFDMNILTGLGQISHILPADLTKAIKPYLLKRGNCLLIALMVLTHLNDDLLFGGHIIARLSWLTFALRIARHGRRYEYG